MDMKKHCRAAILGFIFFAGSFYLYAQVPADAVAEVPELVSFHEVIFKIWHEAWPNKDTERVAVRSGKHAHQASAAD